MTWNTGAGQHFIAVNPSSSLNATGWARARFGIDNGLIHDLMPVAGNPTAGSPTSPLTTPTPDGQGQVVEPSIVYIPKRWNGWEYWMGIAGYTGADHNLENPNILVSHDGQTWQVPVGLTNPVFPKPSAGNNFDPTLCMDRDGTTLYLYWGTENTSPTNTYVSSSTDGITWSAAVSMFSPALGNCPSLVWDGTQYRLYCMGGSATLIYYTGSSPTGPWTGPTSASITGTIFPGSHSASHFNITFTDGQWHCVVMTDDSARLWWCTSADGVTWTIPPAPFLSSGSNTWDAGAIQRAAFLIVEAPTGKAMDVWYIGTNAGQTVWRLGYTRVLLAVFVAQNPKQIPFIVQAAASQSANLAEWRDSTGAVQFAIGPDGTVGRTSAFQVKDGGGNSLFRTLAATAWTDAATATFFQVGAAFANAVFGSAGGNQIGRAMINAFNLQVVRPTSNNAPVPVGLMEVDNDGASVISLVVKAPATPSVDQLQIRDNSNNPHFSVSSGGLPKTGASGDEATGAGTPTFGTNCPAVTVGAPYKWVKWISSDGSTTYIPAWK